MTDAYQFLVGTVVGFHALAGEVKVRPSTNSPDILLEVQTVKVEYAHGVRSDVALKEILKVRSCRLEKRMIFMGFEGLVDRTAVGVLEGASIYAKDSELLPLVEEEFWVSDLVGMEVFTTDGVAVGQVVSIISSGNDLLEVRGENSSGKTILIPFVKSLVPIVDMQAKRIEVVDIPGLLEPQ